MANTVAYYHWPGLWIGEPPRVEVASGRRPVPMDDYVVSDLRLEAFREDLPEGISVKVLREGRFIFDFVGYPPAADPMARSPDFDDVAAVATRRAAILNTHIVCLHRALGLREGIALPKMLVSPLDFLIANRLDDPPVGWINSRLTPLVAASSADSYSKLQPMRTDWRLVERTVVSLSTVEDSYVLLSGLLAHSSAHTLLLVDLYAHASNAYEAHRYDIALVSAWTIIERLLQTLWDRWLEQNRIRVINGDRVHFITADRKQRLTGGRDYTASVVAEVLSLLDQLPLPLYQDLSRVRSDRNSFLHGLTSISRDAADRAVDMAERMLAFVEDVDVSIQRLSLLP